MSRTTNVEKEVSRSIARIQAWVMAFVMGALCGLGMFIMTAWLLIKGGPNVGLHLQLLGQYFIGYSVSWIGCFIGMFYGMLVGGIAGWCIGFIYNRVVDIRRPGK